MSLAWGTINRLAAGATNGTAAVWDMSSILDKSKETLAEKDNGKYYKERIIILDDLSRQMDLYMYMFFNRIYRSMLSPTSS
jgi:hypothetical protein